MIGIFVFITIVLKLLVKQVFFCFYDSVKSHDFAERGFFS